MIGFGVTGLLVAFVLAAITYAVARSYLVNQREDTAIRQTYVNARLARSVLRLTQPDVRSFLAGLGGGTASTTVLRYQDEWFATSVATGREAIPAGLVRVVNGGGAGHHRYRDEDGLRLAVGVAVPAADTAYFELYSLAELERTLDLLARSLSFGVAGAALAAAAVGRAASTRLVRPLRPVADAAQRIASGALDTRLDEKTDPDLRRLVEAFNAMAEALEARIQREARFAADVSHELRSPLAAVAASLEVIDRRREQLPPQVVDALGVLVDKVAMFQQTVLDLLEISKMDAGTADLAIDRVDLRHLIDRLTALHGAEDAQVRVAPDVPSHLEGDRRRLAQALGNLLDNARRYAGGVKTIDVSAARGFIRIALDDHGPGIPSEERDAIFGRFARGESGMHAGSSSGSGLGLALVAEHVKLHHGRVWVEDAPGGGARFVVELPVSAS